MVFLTGRVPAGPTAEIRPFLQSPPLVLAKLALWPEREARRP